MTGHVSDGYQHSSGYYSSNCSSLYDHAWTQWLEEPTPDQLPRSGRATLPLRVVRHAVEGEGDLVLLPILGDVKVLSEYRQRLLHLEPQVSTVTVHGTILRRQGTGN
jgi:hypothetical protein